MERTYITVFTGTGKDANVYVGQVKATSKKAAFKKAAETLERNGYYKMIGLAESAPGEENGHGYLVQPVKKVEPTETDYLVGKGQTGLSLSIELS